MEKNKNTGLVATLIILVIALLGMSGFIIYDKVLKEKDDKEIIDSNDVKEKTELNENKTISLNKYNKIEINNMLNNKIFLSSMNTLKIDDENVIGKNIFDDEDTKLSFAYWHTTYNVYQYDKLKEENVIDKDEPLSCIKSSLIRDIYNEIFNDDISDEAFKHYYDNECGNDYLPLPIATGGYIYTLKVKSLNLNEKTGEYSLTIDFIQCDNQNDNFMKDDYTEYDESLVKHTAIIKYKMQDNKKYLTGWTYIK